MANITERPKILIVSGLSIILLEILAHMFRFPKVGAGPVGLILALSLLKNNVPVRIIEKSDSFHKGTRGPGVKVRLSKRFHLLKANSSQSTTQSLEF